MSITAAVLGTALVAEATIMVPLSLEELTANSRTVVRGTVRQSQSVWGKSHKRIYTLTELEVSEVIRGQAPKTILVRTLGGEVEGIGMKVSGTPKFVADQDVIVFLRPDPMSEGGFMTVGMSQGLYRVEKDSAGRTLAVPGVDGVAFVRARADGRQVVDHRTDVVRMPYEQFRARVRGAPGAPAAPGQTPNPTAPQKAPVVVPQP